MGKKNKKLYRIYYSKQLVLDIPAVWEATKIEGAYEVPVTKKCWLEVCRPNWYSKKELKDGVDRHIADIDGVEREVEVLLPIKQNFLCYHGKKSFEAPKAVQVFVDAVHLLTDKFDNLVPATHKGEDGYATNFENIICKIVEGPGPYTFDINEIMQESGEEEEVSAEEEPDVKKLVGKKVGRKIQSKRKRQDKALRKGGLLPKTKVAKTPPLVEPEDSDDELDEEEEE